jgi:hypothetical protein
MATIDFPNSPTVNDVFTAGNSSYRWTGTAWVSNNLGEIEWDDVTDKPTSFTPSPHAASHGAAGADAITITTGQVTGLSTFVKTMAADISSKTEAYTLVAGDANKLIQADGTFTITVPDDTIPAGTRVDIVNTGTGVITIAGEDLTISSKGGALTIASQYAGATLFFTSTTTALLIGDLA